MVKLSNVQVLRGLAAVAVVMAHIGDPNGYEATWLAGGHHWLEFLHRLGQSGVDLFFVISGLIMMVTTHRLAAGAASARQFMLRRLTRIYPAYWVATLPILALFLVKPDMVNSSQEYPPQVLASLLLLPQPGLPLLLVGWTLTFELYFYVIFALTLLAPRHLRLPLIGGWAALTAVLAVVLAGTQNPWLNLISAPICLEFLFGAVIGWLVTKRVFVAPTVFTVLGFSAAIIAVELGGENFPGTWYRAVPVGLLVAAGVYGVIGLESRWQLTAPSIFQQIGDASYSIYLWHILILTGLGRTIMIRLPDQPVVHAIALVFSLAAVLGCSMVAYRMIERPLMRVLHDRFFRRPDQPKPIVLPQPEQIVSSRLLS